MAIPIVDLSILLEKLTATKEKWEITALDLKQALTKTGFVYLRNHGISQNTVHDVFRRSKVFFDLPLEIKSHYNRDFEKTFHGYTRVGGERMTLDSSLELREMFDVACSDYGGSSCSFPKEVPEFQESVSQLIQETRRTVQIILRLLTYALGISDEDFFIKLHKNISDLSIPSYTQLRTLYYPPVTKEVTANEGIIRCAEHTDYGTVTLLFQDSMGGLEIKTVDGIWIPANPIHGCVLMNVGDLLQIWSGGLFPSSVHRVVVPEEELLQKRQRQSIALFLKPDNTTNVKPLVGKEIIGEVVNAAVHFRGRTLFHRDLAEA